MVFVATIFRVSETRARAGKLDTSLADIDHRGRSGGQRILLPIAVRRADLKPIVVEQGFHLLGKDIAQGRAMRLLHGLTSWMEKRGMAGAVLDLGHGIVVLLLSDHELPSIRSCVRLLIEALSRLSHL